MDSRKRRAAEPLALTRDSKLPRLVHRYKGAVSRTPKVEGIVSRWTQLGHDFVVLFADTAISLVLNMGEVSTTDDSVSDSMHNPFSQSPPSLPALPEVKLPSPRSESSVTTLSPPQSDFSSNGDTLQRSQDAHDAAGRVTSPPTIGMDISLSPEHPQSEQATSAANFVSSDRLDTSVKETLTSTANWPAEQMQKDDVLRGIESLHLDSSYNSMRSSQISDSSTDFSNASRVSQSFSERTAVHPLWRNRRREHIYAQVHRARVRRDHMKLREEMARELFDLKKRQGFTSGYSDFKGLLEYQRRLGDINSDYGSELLATSPFRGKRRLTPRVEPDDESFLQRAIDKAKATLDSPKPPKPFSPTFEQLLDLQRKRDEAIDRRLRPPVPPLPIRLPPEDEEKVSQLLRKRGVISKFAREQVSDQDLARLQPGQWLNDEVINFYGAMILARSQESKENPSATPKVNQPKKAPLNVHYFSSFFWTKLTQEGYDKGRLAKWTKKIDIFSKDIILLPVNHGNSHWTAAAINFRRKRFESYDSMNMAKERVFKALRAYVNDEHNSKKKKPFDFTGWQDWAPESTPQQENGYDCGVFTCQFLESLSRGEEVFNFSQKDMRYLRRRMIWEIGHAQLRNGH